MDTYKPEDAFGMNLRTFKLFGIWPSSVKHPTLRFIYKLYGYAIHLFYIGGFLPSLFTSMYIMRGDLKELVDSSFFTLTCVGYASKLIVFILRRKKIEEFLQRLRDPIFVPRRKEHLDIMKESTGVAKASSLTFLSLCLGTCVTWIIFPLVENREENTLLYAAWYPFNTTMNPTYACTYVSQTFFMLTTAAVDSMIDMMTTNFYVLMIGQMEILKLDFRELTDFAALQHSVSDSGFLKENSLNCAKFDYNQETSISIGSEMPYDIYSSSAKDVSYNEKSLEKLLNDRITKCSLKYQAIVQFINEVTNFFQIGIVVQVCVSSIIICATTYEMTSISPATVQFYTYLPYQWCMLYQIFIYTWRGNNITTKAAELKSAVYECGWIFVPNLKFRRSLCIIMSRLQVPLLPCVGKFFLLSVDTFFKIIRTAYSFYIVLNQLNAQKDQLE